MLTITILVPVGLSHFPQTAHPEGMSLTGSLAILAGWLMITPLNKRDGARAHLLTFAGLSILVLGTFAVIQGQF
jgi:hypothetical protein